MKQWVTDGARVRFNSGSGWSWSHWDGILTVQAPFRGLSVEDRPVALANDFVRLVQKLCGRAYSAMGFDDVPGNVASARIMLHWNTLDPGTTIDSNKIVLASSTGTFTVTCSPSKKICGNVVVPDPVLVKQGCWVVDHVVQNLATSG